jgi:YD repeat-containing protein
MVRTGPKAATTVSVYNSLNQLTAFTETPWEGPVREVSYTYDGAGSRITRTEAGKEQAPDTYSYDREFRLTGLSQTRDATIQITVSPQQTGGVTLSPAAAAARAEATFSRRRDYSYAYDYRTRRVGRIEGGEASTVVFLGGLSVQEYGREASGARKAQPDVEHIRGSGMAGGVGGLVYSVRGAEAAPSYNLYNSRGDVDAQTTAPAPSRGKPHGRRVAGG